MLQRAASNAYSWWWASHIRTKQSKWMEQNLQDMEEKVDAVLKLITKDGDSFAKRAEMYYTQRPELISFVEESFKAYRALAERYDHISKELQNANNTIASVFPEQVQFSMEEEDEEAFRKMQKKMAKPAFIGKNAPQVPQAPTKDFKSIVRSATKKLNPRKMTITSTFPKVVKSGLTKKEGIAEIDKLQKQILVLQTEKEYVKCSYDSSVAKYYQTEDNIKGLQEKVCNLQEEFGEGKVIEDEDARRLMAETALNSCQQTLDELQEKQDKSAEEAIEEFQRIKEAKDKLRSIKGYRENSKVSVTNSEKNVEALKILKGDNKEEIKKGKEKIKKQFDVNSFKSLTVSEMAEKIDELVTKVVGLEIVVSSETAMLNRLRAEANELHRQIKTLEDDKANFSEENTELRNKLKQMEEKLEKLLGVQEINDNLVKQNEQLQMQVTEANRHLDLARATESVKPDTPKNVELQMQEVNEASRNLDVSCKTESVEPDAPPNEEKEASSSVEGTMKDGVDGNHTLNEADDITKSNLAEIANVGQDVDVSGNQQEIPKGKSVKDSTGRDKVASERNVSVNAGDSLRDSEESQNQAQRSNDDSSHSESVSNNIVTLPQIQHDVQSQETEITKMSSGHVNEIHSVNSQRHENSQSEEPDWKQLYLNGLLDREIVLLNQYTTTLQNYKDVKKQLSDIEQKKQDSHVEIAPNQMKELKIANAKKDEEIKQLREQLSLMQRSFDGSAEMREFNVVSNEACSSSSNTEETFKELLAQHSDQDNLSPIEEKFRTDIDELLEENLDYWLKFCASFNEIQKFEIEARDLLGEATKLLKKRMSEGSSNGKYSLRSDARPLYKHLMEVQTELAVWLEKSVSLNEEQKSRFSSLGEIQDEITKTLKEFAELDDFKFTSYQAAKFQGEILNMKQENNKVAEELQAGIDHVTTLQTEVEQSLAKLNEEFGLSGPIKPEKSQLRHPDSQNQIPLRSFIFGVKPKKQRASIFNLHRKYTAYKFN